MVYRRDFRPQAKKGSFISKFSVTHLIIFINVAVFILLNIILFANPSLVNYVAMLPSALLQGKNIWTLLTSVFAHISFTHLFFNMFTLFFMGSLCERIVGRKRFIWFYLIAGIFAGLFFVGFAYLGQYFSGGNFLFGSVDVAGLGASGAIFGLIGLLAALIPRKKVYLIVGPLLVIVLQFVIGSFVSESVNNVINITSTFLIFLMIFSIFSSNAFFRKIAMPLSLPFWIAPVIAIVPLVIISYLLGLKGITLPIGNMAHLGGLVAGLIYGVYLRGKYRQKVKLLNRMIK